MILANSDHIEDTDQQIGIKEQNKNLTTRMLEFQKFQMKVPNLILDVDPEGKTVQVSLLWFTS